jgi:hypothetical protein
MGTGKDALTAQWNGAGKVIDGKAFAGRHRSKVAEVPRG